MLLSRSIICLLVIAASTIASADIRIATIDMGKILQGSTDAKKKLQLIDRKAKEAQKTIEARKKALTKRQKQLEKVKNSDSKETIELRRTARELQRYIADTEEELKAELMEIRQEITAQAYTKVRTFAEKNGIDLVLEKNDARTGPVLFANNAADITTEVLKVMR